MGIVVVIHTHGGVHGDGALAPHINQFHDHVGVNTRDLRRALNGELVNSLFQKGVSRRHLFAIDGERTLQNRVVHLAI